MFLAASRIFGVSHPNTLRVHALTCCEKKKLKFMSASKPVFLDSHSFPSIFLGLVFYILRPGKQNAAQLTVME